MAAAVMLAGPGLSVAIAEKGPRVGRKLLATGSGTCNLSNTHVSLENYHSLCGNAKDFVLPSLEGFSPERAREFFRSIGTETEADRRGRIYPVCRSAAAVLDCLRMAYMSAGAEELTGFEVTGIQNENGFFTVTGTDGRKCAGRCVLVTAGSGAAPQLGGNDKSGECLESFGIRLTGQVPVITQIKTDMRFIKAVKGLRVTARLAVKEGGRELCGATDELLFTDAGLSGPAALYVSRDVSVKTAGGARGLRAEVDFLPDREAGEMIRARKHLDRPADELLTGLLNRRIGQTVLRYSGIDTTGKKCGQLTDGEINRVISAVTGFTAEITGVAGMKEAQAAAGGVDLSEVCPATMELKKQPGIFCAGEMLDIDGDCGGYNLQWAWSSAHTASEAIKRRLSPPGRRV